ncbi:MAG: Smr/MutS family protein [gamma proteobacterium symbiont of Bathyaustriella thionipta]|nr:Smr/MutS family protein [gamma proteobacterium symbiont of Bathyaustriella thionipta]
MNCDSPSDKELFRQAMADVQSIKHENRLTNKQRPKPLRRRHASAQSEDRVQQEHFADRDLPVAEWLEFRRPGLQNKRFQALQRGHFRPQSVLDLHGLRAQEARRQLADFLNHALQHQQQYLLIIHGKGLGSDRQPVLKQLVNSWLQQIPDVMAFCSASRKDGGTGAVYVLLKIMRQNKDG